MSLLNIHHIAIFVLTSLTVLKNPGTNFNGVTLTNILVNVVGWGVVTITPLGTRTYLV